LYVALKQLLDLEKEVGGFMAEAGLTRPFPQVMPTQLHGIELNEYAHQLAQATIWIGYIQWLRDNGFGQPSEPILRPIESIRCMDAILAYDADGLAVEPVWPRADAIIGNPPFLGGNKIRQELGDEYVDALFGLYDGRVPAVADLVCYWFERARALIEKEEINRAGFLATQGIRGGVNRTILERIQESGQIFWAYSDRAWVLDGASVRVSMIAFDGGFEKTKMLDGQVTEKINSDLTALADITQAKRLLENSSIGFRGNQKGGDFDISGDLARTMLSSVGNPNGRPNSDVVKLWYNGMDVTRRPRDMWLIDFGVDMPLDVASQYEQPFEYVKKNVYPVRKNNNRKAYAERWWIHAEARPSMRTAIKPLSRYIVTPHVAKHRVFTWLQANVMPDHQLAVFARDDDYFFGILHSKIHEIWALKLGTALEDRPRYTPTTTFETFPFPWPPGQEPSDDARVQAIASAARELVEKRDRWLNPEGASEAELKKRTLTNLYNARPEWLAIAHRKLDEAVLNAYGWPHDLADEQILERVLALNLERAAAQGEVTPSAEDDDQDAPSLFDEESAPKAKSTRARKTTSKKRAR
jgi:type II restriction/modification system DNA methylase subunit YeeA